MADAKLTNIIIGVVLLGLIISGLSIFMNGFYSTYAVDNPDDDLTIIFSNESTRTIDRVETARTSLSEIEEDKSILDRLASFFRSGYDAALIMLDSIGSVGRLISASVQKIPFLGNFGQVLSITIMALALIVIVIGVFLHFLIKSERI